MNKVQIQITQQVENPQEEDRQKCMIIIMWMNHYLTLFIKKNNMKQKDPTKK